jgi:hypothetical protein
LDESTLYQNKIKPWLLSKGVFFYRIEHMRIPDIYTSKDGIVTWYELKVIETIPRNKLLRPDWRPGQLAWIRDHKKLGGDCIKLILWVVDRWYILLPKEEYKMEELNE